MPGNVTGKSWQSGSQPESGRLLHRMETAFSVQRRGSRRQRMRNASMLSEADAAPARHPIRRAQEPAWQPCMAAAAASHPIQTSLEATGLSRAGQRGAERAEEAKGKPEGAECPVLQQGPEVYPPENLPQAA
uniref:Uncharacterized protein n=1 Tax=Sphaerodactylus townsendi TaxID=933632 RepID=A0ACB8EIX9_9SAUR